ncbi:MAG: hypothetical protein AAGA91_12970 [Pseudomonadota bacterium]
MESHPRLQEQHVRLVLASGNGLDSAIAEVLVVSLSPLYKLQTPAISNVQRLSFHSIDAIQCAAERKQPMSLLVSVSGKTRRNASVEIALADSESAESAWRRWHWRGTLSRAEYEVLQGPVDASFADGSLALPWPSGSVAAAAESLSTQLACDIRRQLVGNVAISFLSDAHYAGDLQDIFNASRQQLGSLRQVQLSAQADLLITYSVQPFQGELLQLWLTGTSASGDFQSVQAVTYIRHGGALALPAIPTDVPPLAPAPADRGIPGHFLLVELLDVSQADKTLSGADLHVQLRLENSGQWPIEYGFHVSGGHYLNCIADPLLYRHDRYGYIEGEIAPGSRQQRRISITGVQHKPNPWFGPRKCAGFKDLQGFENFTAQGHQVTNYLRWSM